MWSGIISASSFLTTYHGIRRIPTTSLSFNLSCLLVVRDCLLCWQRRQSTCLVPVYSWALFFKRPFVKHFLWDCGWQRVSWNLFKIRLFPCEVKIWNWKLKESLVLFFSAAKNYTTLRLLLARPSLPHPQQPPLHNSIQLALNKSSDKSERIFPPSLSISFSVVSA